MLSTHTVAQPLLQILLGVQTVSPRPFSAPGLVMQNRREVYGGERAGTPGEGPGIWDASGWEVCALAWSPSGTQLAVASERGVRVTEDR